MSILIKVYYRLLIDTEKLTGVHLDLPDTFDVSWVLIEGPALDKEVLQYLEGNRDCIPTFPEWLKPLWDAFITNNSDACILRCLRTILVFGYKAEYEPNEKQLEEAQKAFEDANLGVKTWEDSFKTESFPRPTFREARRLIGLVIGRLDWSSLTPQHGPGAVFPSHSPSCKSKFTVCTPIEEYYPYDSHFNCVHNVGMEDLVSHSSPRIDQIIARLTAVPKDSRGPRLICVHPKEAVWIEQGQRHVLEHAIERHPLTAGRINFVDQKVNGRLALSSSLDQEYSTLDLKEASDRIALELVRYLFGYTANILCCSRASHVQLLDRRLLELRMFAPMGNALTFPVESLVFWALVRAGILCRYGINCNDVYVFGDDIIVPTKYYDGAIYGLIQAGLIPNYNKTFRKGFFRESCGVDAYRGKDVTPHRMKVRGVNSYSDGESLCDLAKRLRNSGYTDTSAYLYTCVSRKLGRLTLSNDPNCQGLQEYVDYDLARILKYEPTARFNHRYHAWVVSYRKRVRTVEVLPHHAWWHVQDSLLSLERRSQGIRYSVDKWSREAPLETVFWYGERGLEYPSPRGERLSRGVGFILPT